MKLKDLTVGGIYAIRHETCPHLLLSAGLYHRRTKRMGPPEWSKARPGSRPGRERRSFGFEHTDTGFVMLEGPDEQAITGIDPTPILEALLNGGITAANEVTPDRAHFTLITSLPSILGPYAAVTARRAKERARDLERKQRDVDAYNANADTLNALAGQEILRHQSVSEGWEPTSTLVLAPSDLRLIAERRDEETRRVRILLDAMNRHLTRRAEANEQTRVELWRDVISASEAVAETFHDRIADLDHRAAQLPDGGLATKP